MAKANKVNKLDNKKILKIHIAEVEAHASAYANKKKFGGKKKVLRTAESKAKAQARVARINARAPKASEW